MDQVTTLSLLVLFLALCLPVIHHALHRWPRVYRFLQHAIFAVYVLANLYETVLFRAVRKKPKAKLKPFWSYRKSLSFEDGLTVVNSTLLIEILLNILLYVPLGYLLPFLWPRLRPRKIKGFFLSKWISLRIVLIGFACSLLTESAQYFFRIGLFEIDDLINNTLGCLLGCVLYEIIQRLHRKEET